MLCRYVVISLVLTRDLSAIKDVNVAVSLKVKLGSHQRQNDIVTNDIKRTLSRRKKDVMLEV